MSTTILTVDDDQRFLEIVKRYLEKEPDLSIVGQATDGEQAIRLAREIRPDVVLMDISMPRLNGLEAMRRIKIAYPQTKVIILTINNDEAYRRAASENGSDGFVAKGSLTTTLLPAIEKVTQPHGKGKKPY